MQFLACLVIWRSLQYSLKVFHFHLEIRFLLNEYEPWIQSSGLSKDASEPLLASSSALSLPSTSLCPGTHTKVTCRRAHYFWLKSPRVPAVWPWYFVIHWFWSLISANQLIEEILVSFSQSFLRGFVACSTHLRDADEEKKRKLSSICNAHAQFFN